MNTSVIRGQYHSNVLLMTGGVVDTFTITPDLPDGLSLDPVQGYVCTVVSSSLSLSLSHTHTRSLSLPLSLSDKWLLGLFIE